MELVCEVAQDIDVYTCVCVCVCVSVCVCVTEYNHAPVVPTHRPSLHVCPTRVRQRWSLSPAVVVWQHNYSRRLCVCVAPTRQGLVDCRCVDFSRVLYCVRC